MLAQYRLHEPIGRGASSVVHRATHRFDGRTVAVKLGPPLPLHREARALRRVAHPNVLRRLADGRGFVVVELIDGITLTEHIRTRGALGLEEAISIARHVASGLAALHRAGLIHRDLKPSNVMLPRSGGAVLIDLGIAHFEDRSQPQRPEPGTPGFASPEQERGHEVDLRSDLYSLGCLLSAMLHGRALSRPRLPSRLAPLAHVNREARPASAEAAHSLLSC
jgi:eukaryotic-like serine/threonine-protein kinase